AGAAMIIPTVNSTARRQRDVKCSMYVYVYVKEFWLVGLLGIE
ncbi:hypothetical protein A2U01_0040224, partial [Trifolium medium]|nr:hypothetical protein [Trifolium medium]